MSAVVSACSCGTIGRSDLRQCPEHFHIWRGDKRLASVGRVLACFPQDPCSSCRWPMYSAHQSGCSVKENIDNANERGRQVDALFSAYVLGKLERIPAGTVRKDAAALFMKAKRWFDGQRFKSAKTQLLLADDEIGGICDLRADDLIVDLKATYDVSPTHILQVGGYATLDAENPPDRAAILHVTERYPEARVVHLNITEIVSDWRTLRACWSMVQRRTA